MADRLRAAAAASIGTIASVRDDEVRFISPGHSAVDGICPPVSSGSRRGHPRRRVDAEEFDLSASFPDNGPSAWSDGEDDRDGGSTSDGPSRDVIGRCRPCSSDDGTGGEDVDEFDEADVLWDCSTEIDVTVDNDLGQWAEDDDPHDDYAPRAHYDEVYLREKTMRARELDRAPELQGTSPDGPLGGRDSTASCSSRELRRGQRCKLHYVPTEFL